MDHFYQDIDGFMSGRNTIMLDMVLEQFPKKGTWVELGSWTGRSAAYCVVELINQDKLGEFYCVDSWQGETDIAYDQGVIQDMENIFRKNVNPVIDSITMLTMMSWAAAEKFKDINLTGTVNFSTADKPSLYIDLSRPGPNPSTEMFVIVEGWAEFRTDGKGRAELFSMN